MTALLLSAASSSEAADKGALSSKPVVLESQDWLPVAPEAILEIRTRRGVLYVFLADTLAPRAVERVKALTRQGFYDRLLFHRVIPGFVAQTGNPDNRDGSGSALPDLPPEFTSRQTRIRSQTAAPQGLVYGFLQTVPVAQINSARPSADGRVTTWGLFCRGVVGMGRGDAETSANSELFFMLAAYPALDRRYTVFGRIIAGEGVLDEIPSGEPPSDPDAMQTVRVLADIPHSERPRFESESPESPAFQARLKAMRILKGADFSPCDVTLRTRQLPPSGAPSVP